MEQPRTALPQTASPTQAHTAVRDRPNAPTTDQPAQGGAVTPREPGGQKHSPPSRYVSPRLKIENSRLGRNPLDDGIVPGERPFTPEWWGHKGFGGSNMTARATFTGVGDSGPVVVWTAHVTSVFEDDGATGITVVGLGYPHLVQESVDDVLDGIDSAAAGLLA